MKPKLKKMDGNWHCCGYDVYGNYIFGSASDSETAYKLYQKRRLYYLSAEYMKASNSQYNYFESENFKSGVVSDDVEFNEKAKRDHIMNATNLSNAMLLDPILEKNYVETTSVVDAILIVLAFIIASGVALVTYFKFMGC